MRVCEWRALHFQGKIDHFVSDNLAYAGGEIFFLTNLIIYNGRHETNVMASTFHKNSNDQMKSQSKKMKIKQKMEGINYVNEAFCDYFLIVFTKVIMQNDQRE